MALASWSAQHLLFIGKFESFIVGLAMHNSLVSLAVLQGTKVMQMFVLPLGTSLQPEMLTQQPPLPNHPKLSLNIAGGEVRFNLLH